MQLLESDPQLVEDAVKYIIFLVDADRLFDTALGMYDFSLVLMVAQHAQKVRCNMLQPCGLSRRANAVFDAMNRTRESISRSFGNYEL